MARSDFVYMGFEIPLIDSVDQAVKSVLVHGSPKYVNRKDFVRTAIQNLLKKEMKELEVSA
jgi:Arc/MetJ-type ribon-helix-helix transcriptional regulator